MGGQSVKVKAKKRRGNKGSKKRSIKIRKTPKLKLRKVKKKLLSLTIDFYKREAGQIISVKDGVARVNGLFGVLSGEMVFMGLFKIQGMIKLNSVKIAFKKKVRGVKGQSVKGQSVKVKKKKKKKRKKKFKKKKKKKKKK